LIWLDIIWEDGKKGEAFFKREDRMSKDAEVEMLSIVKNLSGKIERKRSR
jgi:hypothetical protein